MKKILLTILGVLLLSAFANAAPRQFGMLYYKGDTVRTFGVPGKLPHGGTDPLYAVTNGVKGQLGITNYAPGDKEYTGGDWAIYDVTFEEGVEPYLLTSADDVMLAYMAGDVVVTRNAAADIRCPVLP